MLAAYSVRDSLLIREQLDDILNPLEMTSPRIAGAKQPSRSTSGRIKTRREELRRSHRGSGSETFAC
jgi:hypothetical protein